MVKKNGIDLTIIAVYAPQDPRDKFMLWEYLGHVVNQWHGEVVMIKWFWKFFVHKDSLWTKVITAIHGVNGNVSSSGEKAGRSCWLAIVDEVRALHKKGVYVFDFMNLKLGNGEMVKFWLDRWYEGGILKDLFPRLFALENMKEVTVSSKLNGDNLVDSFRRSPRGN